jgi:hypothetical protein
MSSRERSEPLDLERGLPTTRADVVALRRIRGLGTLPTAAYLSALASLPRPSWETLRARPGPRGEVFDLLAPSRVR